MSSNITTPPSLVRPNLDQLRSVAARHHLHISDGDLQQYHDYIHSTLGSYDELDKYPEESLPVRYLSPPGYPRAPETNPYNAWACITNTSGASSGKLFGKTVAIKDNISMAGVPLRIGSEFMTGFVPSYNATVVDRILDAGGVIKGKAVCEDMCFTGNSYTSYPAPVLNPLDPTRTTGGSSSGCGALVANGDVDMAIGTDIGGSIRLPACWCGLVGLKPTNGLVSYVGTVALESTMENNGPMTRTVRDCALLMEVIAGNDGFDPRQPAGITAKNYTEFLTGEVKGFRVGLLKEGFEGCEPDVADLVRSAAQKLTLRGATVTEFSSKLHRQAELMSIPIITKGSYASLTSGAMVPQHVKGFKDVETHDFWFKTMKEKADLLPASMKNILLCNGYLREQYGDRYYAKAVNAMRAVDAGYKQLFETYDVIIMPTIKYKVPKLPPPKLSIKDNLELHLKNIANTIPYNITGHPALSINAGFSEKLPVGMMIVGRHWEDDNVLKVAYAFEQLRDAK